MLQAPKIFVQMWNHNYEDELIKCRRFAVGLAKEIDYKNLRLLEMEHKYNETMATVCRLKEEVKSKDTRFLEMKHKYNESSATVKKLMNETDMLHSGLLFI